MATISKAFAAVGNGDQLSVRRFDSFDYSVTGTFVGTLVLEYTLDQISWTTITTTTTTVASTRFVADGFLVGPAISVRWRCSAYTSGTATANIADVDSLVRDFLDLSGNSVLAVNEGGIAVTGAITVTGAVTRTLQKYIYKAGAKAGTTAGWVVAAGDNVHLLTLPASQTSSTLIIPIDGLKVGWTITACHLIGQIESAGGTVTISYDLRKQTSAAADVVDAAIGSFSPASVTADTQITSANTSVSISSEVVAETETFYFLITGTTAAATDIAIQGAALVITEA